MSQQLFTHQLQLYNNRIRFHSGIKSAVQTVKLQENRSHRGAVKPELNTNISVYFLFPDPINCLKPVWQLTCFYFMFMFQKIKLVSEMFPWLKEEQWKHTVSMIKSWIIHESKPESCVCVCVCVLSNAGCFLQLSPYDNLLLCQPVSSPLPLRWVGCSLNIVW